MRLRDPHRMPTRQDNRILVVLAVLMVLAVAYGVIHYVLPLFDTLNATLTGVAP